MKAYCVPDTLLTIYMHAYLIDINMKYYYDPDFASEASEAQKGRTNLPKFTGVIDC